MSSTLRERVFAKLIIDPETGCLNWTGATSDGYGHTSAGLVHRLMHEWFIGPIPDRYEVDHLCCNIACAAPAHLEAVTHAENVRRAKARITHCPQGHSYDDANTYRRPSRPHWRACRACHNAGAHRARDRRRALK